MIRKPKVWPYPLGNPTLSKLWEKNLTRLDGEIIVPFVPFSFSLSTPANLSALIQ